MVLRDLAAGEAAAGGALHGIVADGGGTEASMKKAGECLSNAQLLYEEMGELGQMQLMMRQQGSLYLAAALCASLDGEGHERAATSRLTLALRHYERALAPHLLASASVCKRVRSSACQRVRSSACRRVRVLALARQQVSRVRSWSCVRHHTCDSRCDRRAWPQRGAAVVSCERRRSQHAQRQHAQHDEL